uniref:Synaptotagmin-5-like n=1 Tax=Phallusia mammillata TaxID=59560 RepID=A0A6F9DTJ2_9ASCI|nr:synaptotagmin-5-like [Phallusia mammillata]
MTLTGGAIAGIAIVSIIGFGLIVWLIVYVIKKRQRDAAYFDRCSRILKKYGNKAHNDVIAKFPYAGATFVRAPAPGQQMTSRELSASQEFVVPPTRNYDVDEGDEAERKQLISMNKPIDPSAIDPRLYSPEFIDQDPGSPTSGRRPPQVFFSIEFDPVFNILRIHVDQARYLKPKDQSQFSNPYCVVSVLPGSHSKESHKIRNTVDPLFQENFSFEVQPHELREKTVQIKFFNYDQYSRDESMGTVVQRLDEFKLDNRVDLWRKIYQLEPHEKIGSEHQSGDMLLRIGYLPSAEKLTVVLLKARSLNEVETDGERRAPDPYIRVSIYHEGNLLKKKKTSTKRRTCNPTYNQAINFAVPLDVLPQVEIQFSVVHESGLKINRAERKEAIGYLEIGPHSSGAEFEHWRDLMSNKPQARWHHLAAPTGIDQPTTSGQSGAGIDDDVPTSSQSTS